MTFKVRSILMISAGVALGLFGLALGAYLGVGNNGWRTAIFFSIVGLIGAPLTAFSWTSLRSRRRNIVAAIALTLGVLASMGLLLELTAEFSEIKFSITQVPWLVLVWFAIWVTWIGGALMRLLMYTPHETHQRLSSRRGDSGR